MLLPVPLRESFDGENPWVRRLVGWPLARASWRTRLGLAAMVLVLACLGAGFGASFALRDAGLMATTGSLAYALLVTWAFLAPSLGALARRRLDFDPCLPESLASPLPDRAYLAPVHGRLVVQSAFGGLLHALVAAFCLALVIHPDARLANALAVESLLRMVLRMMAFGRIHTTAGTVDLWLCAAFAVVATANYTAGVYLHGSMLARMCQRAPMANVNGGVLTALQILLMMTLLAARFLTVRHFLQGVFGWPGGTTGLLVYFLAAEGAVLLLRVAWARWTWRRLLADAFEETRRHAAGA